MSSSWFSKFHDSPKSWTQCLRGRRLMNTWMNVSSLRKDYRNNIEYFSASFDWGICWCSSKQSSSYTNRTPSVFSWLKQWVENQWKLKEKLLKKMIPVRCDYCWLILPVSDTNITLRDRSKGLSEFYRDSMVQLDFDAKMSSDGEGKVRIWPTYTLWPDHCHIEVQIPEV